MTIPHYHRKITRLDKFMLKYCAFRYWFRKTWLYDFFFGTVSGSTVVAGLFVAIGVAPILALIFVLIMMYFS